MTEVAPGGTRLLALLGDPVAHSLSPRIQNAALRALGLNAVYLALRVAPDDVEGLLLGVARAGGGGNVTLPHKERAAMAVEVPSDAVRRTGACNTFWLEQGRVHGDNTDVEGFRLALLELLGRPLLGARVLLIGAGGAARAALLALLDEGAEEIAILNRNRERAIEVREAIARDARRVRVLGGVADAVATPWDLVVNATRLGMGDRDETPFPLTGAPRPGAVMDLVYRPDETAWVREARTFDIPAADGGAMLVHQGAAAFSRWWGRDAPLGVMREALTDVRGR